MTKTKNEFSNAVPIWKFILLSMATMGIYEFFWFYRNWKMIKEKEKLNIMPFWRTFFSIFFVYSLFKKINKITSKEGYTDTFSAGRLAFFWIVLSIMWRLPDPYWLVSFLSVFAVLPSLKAMNYYWGKKQPKAVQRRFSWWQIILILLGCVVFVFAIYGTLVP